MDSLYSESSYYRMLFAERAHDLPFYLRVTEPAGEVLELGAGEGRVTLPLAEAGRRVVAVDRSEPMLAALAERLERAPAEVRERVALRAADARSLRLERSFARVLLPFNGLAHFHDETARAALFESVRAHLAPGGLFAFDVAIPDPAYRRGASSVPWLRHPRTGRVCRLEERYEHDERASVLTITTALVDRETGVEQVLTLSLAQLSPEQTRELLARSGLEILEEADLGDARAYAVRAR